MRRTNASISPAVRGRPGPRWPLPSYFCAISFRCQANKVSHVTMGLISSRRRRVSPLGFHGQSTALIVVKPKPTFAELLAQRPVLLAQVIDDLVFPCHPTAATVLRCVPATSNFLTLRERMNTTHCVYN